MLICLCVCLSSFMNNLFLEKGKTLKGHSDSLFLGSILITVQDMKQSNVSKSITYRYIFCYFVFTCKHRKMIAFYEAWVTNRLITLNFVPFPQTISTRGEL